MYAVDAARGGNGSYCGVFEVADADAPIGATTKVKLGPAKYGYSGQHIAVTRIYFALTVTGLRIFFEHTVKRFSFDTNYLEIRNRRNVRM